MKVNLAGYNIDSSLIATLDQETATPEVISAAYARISRSARSVTELRSAALKEIAKARNSNRSIIFEMGHASVAEHAVFNIDIIGISRHLTETVQRSRLASFTEKSQRYVTFEQDFVIPAELEGTIRLKKCYIQLCNKLFAEYRHCYELLDSYYANESPQLGKRDRECLSKEDARYILPLAAKTQMGVTINARSLEVLLRRLSVHPALEARELHRQLYEEVHSIAPSLIRYTEADAFGGSPDPNLLPDKILGIALPPGSVSLVSSPEDTDRTLLALMLFERGLSPFKECYAYLGGVGEDRLKELYSTVFEGLKPYHKLPRCFEAAEFCFQISMSECCWAQFKRHRSATLIKQVPTQAELVIPESVAALGREAVWQKLLGEVKDFRKEISDAVELEGGERHGPLPAVLPYTALNAETVNIFAKMNLRELYHFSRLRSDVHAQWEIRRISDQMLDLVKQHAPLAGQHLKGKSGFVCETSETRNQD